MIVITELTATGYIYTRQFDVILGDGHRLASLHPGTFEAVGKWSCVTKHQNRCDCLPLQTFTCAECETVCGYCYGAADDWPELCDDCAARKL